MKSEPNILNFEREKIVWLVLAFFVCSTCLPQIALSGPPDNSRTFFEQLDILLGRLTKIPEPETNKWFKDYKPILAKEIDIANLYSSTPQDLDTLLDTAQKESIDVLTLFTLPAIQKNKGKAIALDEKTLLDLNIRYDLHGLFLIATDSANDDSKVKMNFLIVGQGKLIIGYNRNTTIAHPEYDVATGIYEYQRLFLMDAKTDEQGNCGLFNIRGLSSPSEPFRQMKGPLNSKIQSLSIPLDLRKEKKLLVRYRFLADSEKVVDCIPIEKIAGGTFVKQ